ncbi:MAG: calcium-binding protein [Pseudodonghicola sp.]
MAEFIIHGPELTTVTGTEGDDRLIYFLESGPGGMLLQLPTPNPLGGYDGVFLPTDGDPTHFTGIENISFVDQVGGDDTLTTGGGDDVLTGGGGRDVLTGGAGIDTLSGGNRNDILRGGDDGDWVHGGNGNDRMFGDVGNDSLIGGNGNDRLFGGTGNDFIDGGDGDDLIYGGVGEDFIIADAGTDVVLAGAGKDMVEISFDAIKTIDGGGARDMLTVFHFTEAPAGMRLTFDMTTGAFTATDAIMAASTATNFEDFAFQGDINVKMLGTDVANQLFGSVGNDILRGGDGRDALFGEDGNDLLRGNQKADLLNGGLGDDIMIGGAGADTFIFAGGLDQITDFKNDVDTIQVLGGLVPFGTTVQDLVDSATVVDGNTVIALDADNVLTIKGLTDAALLLDDLLIV